MNQHRIGCSLLLLWAPFFLHAAEPLNATNRATKALAEYFQRETAELRNHCLAGIRTLEDWKSRREDYRKQLLEMLGLDPLPARSDLKTVVTGKVEREDFAVEKLHFQSLPGLYVTANLYLPKGITQPAPTILYVSGHGPVISNGVSYGNKVAYQHHGAWFARNGYVCLILDTLQLGEIQGLHHGTYREKMWWWNARGYTPAGVEAWNSIRALDYLQTRPEVDAQRFGVTGRSGGGAYSWWLAAVDDRIKAAAPVAGITDLQNHVVDGCVEGHCDCMFTVNTYRWDYPQVAALVAPRPLLIVNTDSDSIFPLDGVVWLHGKVRQIYRLYGAATNLGLVIGPGPHKDTQNMQVPVFRWFNVHLKGADPLIDMAATKFFRPQELKVFETLPADAINTNIQERFVPMAKTPEIPTAKAQWEQQRDIWLSALKTKSFAGWPTNDIPLQLEKRIDVARNGLHFQAFDFTSQPSVRLRLYLLSKAGLKKPEHLVLNIFDQPHGGNTPMPSSSLLSYPQWLGTMQVGFAGELAEELGARTPTSANTSPLSAEAEKAFSHLQAKLRTNTLLWAYFAPRGLGLDTWVGNEKKQVQIRRRFMLLGQTLDAMRVWDIRRAIQAVRAAAGRPKAEFDLQAEGNMACNALYASLFEPDISMLNLSHPPVSHNAGPDYLNVLRVLDIPQAVTIAAEHSQVHIITPQPLVSTFNMGEGWMFPFVTARTLGWPKDCIVRADASSPHSF